MSTKSFVDLSRISDSNWRLTEVFCIKSMSARIKILFDSNLQEDSKVKGERSTSVKSLVRAFTPDRKSSDREITRSRSRTRDVSRDRVSRLA